MNRLMLTTSLLMLIPAIAWGQSYRVPVHGDGVEPSGNSIVSAYFDHGGNDWNCEGRRYSGHRGTDFAPYHAFGTCISTFWAVAAAAGRVLVATDGEEDHCDCTDCGSGFGNHVIIEHTDGRRTIYGHLANGTVAVRTGDEISCGQRLGRIGMTGNTTGPHVHFEVRGSGGGAAVDPYHGPCSSSPSLWTDQGVYGYGELPSTACDGGGPPPAEVVCGDGICEGAEDCSSCVTDCGACGPSCGDGRCEGSESCDSCASDCGSCGPSCGDGRCEGSESCDSCASDCGSCGPSCGDGTCNGGEDCSMCPRDCGACGPICGDGRCEGSEDCDSCSTDCGTCLPTCGSGLECSSSRVGGSSACVQWSGGPTVHCCPAGQEIIDGRCQVPQPICGSGLVCSTSRVGGSSSCVQWAGGPTVYCCSSGQEIIDGRCQVSLPTCGSGLECSASRLSGSSACVQWAGGPTVYCCPSGQSNVGGRCM